MYYFMSMYMTTSYRQCRIVEIGQSFYRVHRTNKMIILLCDVPTYYVE